MVLSGTRLDNTFAMKEYEISRYDGKALVSKQRTDTDWNKAKDNNFIDFYCKKKAFLPAPNVYKNIEAGYMVKVRANSLYKSPRRTDISDLVKQATKSKDVGPGSLHPKDQKLRVLGSYGGLERVTMAASTILEAANVPASNKYDLPSFVSIPYRLLLRYLFRTSRERRSAAPSSRMSQTCRRKS